MEGYLIFTNLKRLLSGSSALMSLGRPIKIDAPWAALSNLGSCSGPSISQTLVNSAFADLARVFSHLKGFVLLKLSMGLCKGQKQSLSTCRLQPRPF